MEVVAMASVNNDLAVKAREIREALALQREKSDRMVQRASRIKEDLPDIKVKMEDASRTVARIQQATNISRSNVLASDLSKSSKVGEEVKITSSKSLLKTRPHANLSAL